MEQFDRAQEREYAAQQAKIASVITVRSLSDLQRVLSELDPKYAPAMTTVAISTTLPVQEPTGRMVYAVSVDAVSESKRGVLLRGFTEIRDQLALAETAAAATTVNGRTVIGRVPRHAAAARAWIDPLISRWLDGSRDGLTIVWNLADGLEYRYDIFTHALKRTRHDPTSAAISTIS